ncbi:MAG: hypothetical protein JW795_20575 [Chitinivibrionales bacterium]|nr:hypothetical protein [Chitinivibrionales bacterium]
MRRVVIWYCLTTFCFFFFSTNAAAFEGFYKTIFIDGGVGLVKMRSLPAADQLKFPYEFIAVDSTGADTQNLLMVKNPTDDNGVLLYPDGEPRFSLLYTCGGYGDHLESLGKDGKQRIRDFYFHGGSYVGTCAGNYLACRWAYNLYPGSIKSVAIKDKVGGIIPKDSPLLKYFDFGGDHYIDSIMHADGGYGKVPLPPKTELMLIHRHASEMDSQPSCWAYKENDTTGRVVGLTSHPEFERRGEKLNYFMACLQYSLAGLAPPSIKGALERNQKRVMNKSTGDNSVAFTKIGDLQYHHFFIDLAEKTDNVLIKIDGDDGFDFHIFAAKDTLAFKGSAPFADTSAGSDKTLLIKAADAGRWYIGVKCASTVTATKKNWGYEYSGKLEVLNGVAYTIEAHWGESSIKNMSLKTGIPSVQLLTRHAAMQISADISTAYTLKIYNTRGALCLQHHKTAGAPEQFLWQPETSGMFVASVTSLHNQCTYRFTLLR